MLLALKIIFLIAGFDADGRDHDMIVEQVL